jgi:hypothetical protein
MEANIIAVGLLVAGWGMFFYGANWMRRARWARGPFVLFWCSTALLGCASFWYGVQPLLQWGQIALAMLAGVLGSVAVSIVWGTISSEPRATPQKAADTARADTPPVGKWSVPGFSDMMGGGNPWAYSPTIAGIEAMGGD